MPSVMALLVWTSDWRHGFGCSSEIQFARINSKINMAQRAEIYGTEHAAQDSRTYGTRAADIRHRAAAAKERNVLIRGKLLVQKITEQRLETRIFVHLTILAEQESLELLGKRVPLI